MHTHHFSQPQQLAFPFASPSIPTASPLQPALPTPSQQPTMSSREIAELTGKNHADVMRDIRNMLGELGQVASNFAGYYIAANGKENPLFNLPKDLTITLVSGYSAPMRHRIVTRWLELEGAHAASSSAHAFKVPESLPEALRLAADLQETNQRLALENTTLALKAQALDAVAGEKGRLLSEITRTLKGVNTQAVKKDLLALRRLYKTPSGKYRVYAVFQYCYLERFDAESGRRELYVTAKGIADLTQLHQDKRLTMKKAA